MRPTTCLVRVGCARRRHRRGPRAKGPTAGRLVCGLVWRAGTSAACGRPVGTLRLREAGAWADGPDRCAVARHRGSGMLAASLRRGRLGCSGWWRRSAAPGAWRPWSRPAPTPPLHRRVQGRRQPPRNAVRQSMSSPSPTTNRPPFSSNEPGAMRRRMRFSWMHSTADSRSATASRAPGRAVRPGPRVTAGPCRPAAGAACSQRRHVPPVGPRRRER